MKSNQPIKITRNFWPYGIILTFVIFIGGTTGLIVLACRQNADLVSANYYEDEVRFQTQIDRFERSRNLDARASVSYDSSQKRISIALPAEHALTGTQGRIQLYRPSAAGLDQTLELKPDASGVQFVDARNLQPGLWKVRVLWTANGADYRVDEKLVIDPKKS